MSSNGRSRWRQLVAVSGVSFVLGLGLGAVLLGDLGEVPCYEVEEQAQPARDRLADTFGGGEEGREAIRELVALAREHPGCFDPENVALLERELEEADGTATLEPTDEASSEPTSTSTTP